VLSILNPSAEYNWIKYTANIIKRYKTTALFSRKTGSMAKYPHSKEHLNRQAYRMYGIWHLGKAGIPDF